MSEVLAKVREIMAKEGQVPAERIEPAASLKELNLESLDAVQVIFAIEEHYGISLPYDNLDVETQTVGDLVTTVERLLGGKQQPVS